MKRSPTKDLEKKSKHQKIQTGKKVIKKGKKFSFYEDDVAFHASDNEFETADNFFATQHFSLTRNWDISCLMPWHKPTEKLSKKTSGLNHSFIELNNNIICLANSSINKNAILGKGAGGSVK